MFYSSLNSNPDLFQIDVTRANATFFTSDELHNGSLVYHHDDSESRRDSFHVFATSTRSGQPFQYLAVFHIRVILRNDQTPTRVVDKVFQVGFKGLDFWPFFIYALSFASGR